MQAFIYGRHSSKPMQQAKLTIKQIKEVVTEHVKNVVDVKKMSATNTWFIFVKTNEDALEAIEKLEWLNFSVSKCTKKAIKENKVHAKNMMCYFEQLPSTYYERMMKSRE